MEDEINPDTINLESKSLGDVEVLLDGDTIYKVPGHEEASVDDIVEGSRLAVLATPEGEEGVYTAVRIMVVPDGATHRHMNGVVVATQEKTMTMMNNNGETWQVNLPEGVHGGEVGEFVSVAVRNSAGEGTYEASGLQIAAAVQTRLQAQINELAGQGSRTQAEVQNRERAMERLGDLCEGLAERHMQVLNDVLEEAPEGARAAIQAAIQSVQQAMEQAQNTTQGLNAGTGGQNSN